MAVIDWVGQEGARRRLSLIGLAAVWQDGRRWGLSVSGSGLYSIVDNGKLQDPEQSCWFVAHHTQPTKKLLLLFYTAIDASHNTFLCLCAIEISKIILPISIYISICILHQWSMIADAIQYLLSVPTQISLYVHRADILGKVHVALDWLLETLWTRFGLAKIGYFLTCFRKE